MKKITVAGRERWVPDVISPSTILQQEGGQSNREVVVLSPNGQKTIMPRGSIRPVNDGEAFDSQPTVIDGFRN